MNFDLSGVSVMIGIPTNRAFDWRTTKALIGTCLLFQANKISFDLKMVPGGSIVETSRSKVAHHFLRSPLNRLFMIDSDQTWQPEDAMRLLALSTKMECVGACYPAKSEPLSFMIRAQKRIERNQWGCLEVEGMGLGFTVVQRKVIEQLAERAPKLEFHDIKNGPVAHLFRTGVHEGAFMGEDMVFFADVMALGYKVNLDPAIQVGHLGTKEYKGSFEVV